VSEQVYLLAEIAPLSTQFGVGPKGVDWPAARRVEQAGQIQEQIDNIYYLADEKDLPLVDVYSATLGKDGFGLPEYVNTDDGIHLSKMGEVLTAQLIVAALVLPDGQ
jgi:lysophospholipase L1-like esterase